MKIEGSRFVYLLHHLHAFEDKNEDWKLLGVYSCEEKANESIAKFKTLPGFEDHPDGFTIDQYTLDQELWDEGFVTVYGTNGDTMDIPNWSKKYTRQHGEPAQDFARRILELKGKSHRTGSESEFHKIKKGCSGNTY